MALKNQEGGSEISRCRLAVVVQFTMCRGCGCFLLLFLVVVVVVVVVDPLSCQDKGFKTCLV